MDLIPLRNFVLKLLLAKSQDLPRDGCETSEDTDLDFSAGDGEAEDVKRCLILLTKFRFFFFLFEYIARSKRGCNKWKIVRKYQIRNIFKDILVSQ